MLDVSQFVVKIFRPSAAFVEKEEYEDFNIGLFFTLPRCFFQARSNAVPLPGSV